jgi:hypothetical protein
VRNLTRFLVIPIALYLPTFYRQFLQGVHILMQIFYVLFIRDVPIRYTAANEKPNARVDVHRNIIYIQ